MLTKPFPVSCEGADWGVDPDSGARVVRLTSAAMNNNIYCEQPYASPDGRRVMIARALDMFAASRQLLVADLESLTLTMIESDVPHELVAHSSWREWAYYLMHDGSVRRVSLLTLERQSVLPAGTLTASSSCLESITPDDQWLIAYEGVDGPELRSLAISTVDGTRRTLYEGADNRNPHAQAEPGDGQRWLYQLIREGREPRVPVFAAALDGGTPRQLPFGGEWSAESTGHMAWVADTGRVACAMNWRRAEKRHDPRHSEGNLLIAAPGDAEASVFPAAEHGFYHVSISRCGQYFVCDDFMDFRTDAFASGAPGPVGIVVGNLATGKHRTLIGDCQAYGIAGSSRFEPDPYFTADNRHVVYNASPFGAVQVFAAEVPPDFLPSLSLETGSAPEGRV